MERNYLSRKTRFQMLITERPNIFTENIIIVICRSPLLSQKPKFRDSSHNSSPSPSWYNARQGSLACTLQVPDAISPLVDRPQFLTFHI